MDNVNNRNIHPGLRALAKSIEADRTADGPENAPPERETVSLGGVPIAKVEVAATLLVLQRMYREVNGALDRLINHCRTGAELTFGGCLALRDTGLIEWNGTMRDPGKVNEATKAIVLASFKGEGLNLEMVNPVSGRSLERFG